MRRGRRLPELTLTVEENNRLIEWTRRRKSAQALALRARTVLACAHGERNGELAKRLHVTLQTVGKWGRRFIDLRQDGPSEPDCGGTHLARLWFAAASPGNVQAVHRSAVHRQGA